MQQNVEEGTHLGVTGPPAFVVNGRLVSGARPLESFTRVMEDELARTRCGTRPCSGRAPDAHFCPMEQEQPHSPPPQRVGYRYEGQRYRA